MKRLFIIAAALAVAVGSGRMIAQDAAPEAPTTLVFEAKTGNVTFDHGKHVESAGGDCETCHDALWPAERVDLGYKASMHKKAEAEGTSCAACHRPEGPAFESKANCKRCHVKE
jgi:c(7)-type cytochrome triheme protein